MRRQPGTVRDAIVEVLEGRRQGASVDQITEGVRSLIGDVPASSVRSYLRLNTPALFARMERAQYTLAGFEKPPSAHRLENKRPVSFACGQASLLLDDCNDWLDRQPVNSIHAVVTDPPYGLIEYTETEQTKLRAGAGGVWRIPPQF